MNSLKLLPIPSACENNTLPKTTESSTRASKVFTILLGILFFAIPIEHQYDKWFRFYSLTLRPEGLILPSFFNQKISFYLSDLLLLVLFGWLMATRSSLLRRGGIYLLLLYAFALRSILLSPLVHYPVIYVRLLQFLSPLILFWVLANGPLIKKRLFQVISWGIVATSSMQSILALVQYVLQRPLGLRLLNEHALTATIHVPEGRRTLFDFLFHRIHDQEIYRAIGTLSHANLLGGLLMVGLLFTTYLLWATPKWRKAIAVSYFLQFFALGVTFSRAALFATVLGTLVWLGWMRHCFLRSSWRFLVSIICCSSLLVGGFLYEQILYRGGIVNYPLSAAAADRERIADHQVALQMIASSPFNGVGFGQFELGASRLSSDQPHKKIVHNIYLLLAVELGCLALLVFLIWIARLLWVAFRTIPNPELGILFSIFLALLFIGCCDFYLIYCQQGRLLFFGIAGLLARFAYERTAREPSHIGSQFNSFFFKG